MSSPVPCVLNSPPGLWMPCKECIPIRGLLDHTHYALFMQSQIPGIRMHSIAANSEFGVCKYVAIQFSSC